MIVTKAIYALLVGVGIGAGAAVVGRAFNRPTLEAEKLTRPAVKNLLKRALRTMEWSREGVARAREDFDDLLAEARAEVDDELRRNHKRDRSVGAPGGNAESEPLAEHAVG